MEKADNDCHERRAVCAYAPWLGSANPSPLCSLFHRNCCRPSEMQHVAAVLADQHEGIPAETLQVEGLEPSSHELVLLTPELLLATNGALHAGVADRGLGCLGHHFPFCVELCIYDFRIRRLSSLSFRITSRHSFCSE